MASRRPNHHRALAAGVQSLRQVLPTSRSMTAGALPAPAGTRGEPRMSATSWKARQTQRPLRRCLPLESPCISRRRLLADCRLREKDPGKDRAGETPSQSKLSSIAPPQALTRPRPRCLHLRLHRLLPLQSLSRTKGTHRVHLRLAMRHHYRKMVPTLLRPPKTPTPRRSRLVRRN